MKVPRRISYLIPKDFVGRSVENILKHEMHCASAAIRRGKLIENGITLDNALIFTNAKVKGGELLSIQVGDRVGSPHIIPEKGTLDIVYEDEDILVLNKKAPMPVHPSMGHSTGTLANYVMGYYEDIGLLAGFHCINRLDSGTSGIMMIGKHSHAHEVFGQLLHSNDFERRYLAVCEGIPEPKAGLIDAPIDRVEEALLQRGIFPWGDEARTHYETLKTVGNRSLVSLKLDTGRTHQIRVHMQYIGCPLVGDFLYGKEEKSMPRRFALHATELKVTHPISGENLHLTAPLPPELEALLEERP